MQNFTIKAGATSQIIPISIYDSSSTTGAKLAGLVFNSAGLTAYYNRTGAAGAATAITLATATKGTWATGGFVAIDGTNMPGDYELHIPDAAIASGATSVLVQLKGATNMVPKNIMIQLVAYDPQDTVRLGLTALPNAVAGGSAGVPVVGTGTNNFKSDVSANVTFANTSIATAFNVSTVNGLAAGVVTATSIAASALNGKGDWNVGKTGYALSAAGVQAIWDALTSALTTAGSIGKKLADWVLGSDNKVILSNNAHTGAVVPTVTDVTNLHASAATAANQTTILNRIGDFAGTGLNTLKGFFQALFRKDAGVSGANLPSEINEIENTVTGTYDATTDSQEAIRDTAPLGTAMRGTDSAATAAALATAQADLDTITGTDGVTLATAQALYAPAKAGDQMALINDAITAAKIATDALGALELATDAVNEIRDAIISDATTFAGADIAIIKGRLPAALIGGRMDSDVEAINNDTEAAIDLKASAKTIVRGTVDTVVNTHTPTTIEFQADDITEATTDHFKGRTVIFTSGALKDQGTDITGYALVGTIGQFTVTAMTEAPANNDTFVVV